MKIKFIYIIFISLFFLGSCKTMGLISKEKEIVSLKKAANEAIDKNNLPEKVMVANMDFHYSADKNITARLNFHSQLNKNLFASVRYLGFEVLRLGLYPDSLKYINRFQRSFFFDDYSNINNLPLELNFNLLQTFLLTGFYYNPGWKRKDYLKKFQSEQDPVVIYENPLPGKKFTFYYKQTNAKLDKLEISDYSSMIEITASFEYTDSKLNKIFGTIINKGVMGTFELDNIEIQHKSYSNTDFKLGKNYTKLENVF